jgi:hypothetical protein
VTRTKLGSRLGLRLNVQPFVLRYDGMVPVHLYAVEGKRVSVGGHGCATKVGSAAWAGLGLEECHRTTWVPDPESGDQTLTRVANPICFSLDYDMESYEFSNRSEFNRTHPASERELLLSESPSTGQQREHNFFLPRGCVSIDAAGLLRVSVECDKYVEGHSRVLAMLEARIDGRIAPIPPQMLEQQSFTGLSFVGITASLHGLDGLFAQCAWFETDDIDWFWVEITDVRALVVLQDARFRGGSVKHSRFQGRLLTLLHQHAVSVVEHRLC